MRKLYQLGTVGGIPVRMHYTWFITLIIGFFATSGILLPQALPTIGAGAHLALALATAGLAVLVVLLHELAHVVAARLVGVPIRAINLYPLGSLTRLPARQPGPWQALLTAAAGPAASLLLWALLARLSALDGIPAWLDLLLVTAAQLSLLLGLLNLLPGLPLDGGHMARAAGWFLSGTPEAGITGALRIGQIIGYGAVVLGGIALVGGEASLREFALIGFGWLVLEAGGALRRRALVDNLLSQLTAGAVARPPSLVASAQQTLRQFAQHVRGRPAVDLVPVVEGGTFLGMLDQERLREIPQGYWDEGTVEQAMLPAALLRPVNPATPMSRVLPRLVKASAGGSRLPVVEQGRLVGLIDSREIQELLELEEDVGLLERPQAQEYRGSPSRTSWKAGSSPLSAVASKRSGQ